MPEELPLQNLLYAVSYVARSQSIDRIVALDEFDMENVSALREHLRITGMGLTAVRYFRDKLAMRERARKEGILVPNSSTFSTTIIFANSCPGFQSLVAQAPLGRPPASA